MSKNLRKLKLRIKQLEIEKGIIKPKEMLTLINMPCELGDRFVLQMTEGYTKKDLEKVKKWIFEIVLPNNVKLYKEIRWKEAK